MSKKGKVVAKSKMGSKRKTGARRKITRAITYILIVLVSAVAAFFIVKYVVPNATDYLTGIEPQTEIQEDYRETKDEIKPEGEWIVEPSKPRYMTIAKIGINNARVVELGTSGEDNQLEDPQNIHDAGWYRESALPGAPTDTQYAGLYDGHNTGLNQKGIFYSLDRLVIGDVITIERGDGVLFSYEVREMEVPLLEEIDMTKMQKSFDPEIEGLNIITCGGNWDQARQTYTHRVTVRATIVE